MVGLFINFRGSSNFNIDNSRSTKWKEPVLGSLTFTKPRLNMLDGTQTDQAASLHDTHTTTQRLALLHAVGREHSTHISLCDGICNEVPHGSSSDRIHAAAGLIQKQYRWVSNLRSQSSNSASHISVRKLICWTETGALTEGTNQCNRERQLALVTTAVRACHPVSIFLKPNSFDQISDNLGYVVRWNSFQAGIHVQVFSGCHEVEQWIELGAIAYLLLGSCKLTQHGVTSNERVTTCWFNVTTQDWERRCFPCSIHTSAQDENKNTPLLDGICHINELVKKHYAIERLKGL